MNNKERLLELVSKKKKYYLLSLIKSPHEIIEKITSLVKEFKDSFFKKCIFVVLEEGLSYWILNKNNVILLWDKKISREAIMNL